MIKAITFDLDGVYFINGKSRFIESISSLGIPESEVRRVFLESDEMNKIYKVGKMNDTKFWSWAAREWHINKNPEEIIKTLIEGYETDERVVTMVKKARKNGYKTLICSNNFPARVKGLQKKFNFLDNFDVAIFSYEVGVTKPSPLIFQQLISQANVNPEEIVYSDDSPDKLSGAIQLGIRAFVYEGFDKFVEKLKELDVNISPNI